MSVGFQEAKPVEVLRRHSERAERRRSIAEFQYYIEIDTLVKYQLINSLIYDPCQ
jgi:hypothetical protein